MLWITETSASATSSRSESSMSQISILNLNESVDKSVTATQQGRASTLLELFLHSVGGAQARVLLAHSQNLDETSASQWSLSLLPYLTIVGQLVWPISKNFLFPEFLLSSCQYLQVQEYVRLLRNWCDWNKYSRKFLLGSAFLNLGEPAKAFDCFVNAAEGVVLEEFLASKIIGADDEEDEDKIRGLYFEKVIDLFDTFNHPHFVISLAKTAMQKSDSTTLPRLFSTTFSNHLKLGHIQEAYDDIVANPDAIRRRDCLRHFVFTLFERKLLQTLNSFGFVGLYKDLENIVEGRARSLDIIDNPYYDFLYAFHIYRENLRKAATVMYEQGMRLGLETVGVKGLQEQAKRYLACLNALHLVDPKNAWIVKPVVGPKDSDEFQHVPPGLSPKRKSDGEEIFGSQMKRSVEVLEYDDLKKEYEIVQAKLRLVKKQPHYATSVGPLVSVGELVGLLTTVGLFDQAMRMCHLFGMSSTIVVEGLASKCLHLTNAPSSVAAEAWDWLIENEFTAWSSRTGSAVDEAWRLLEHYLSKYEAGPKQTVLHKAVASRLLNLGAFLPNWIITSYKRRDPAELIRLYLGCGQLDHAGRLSLQYVDAVLGKGPEHFGLSNALRASGAPVWLPYTAFDQLLMELRSASSTDAVYEELHKMLTDKLNAYFQTAQNISSDIVKTANQRALRITASS